MARPRRSPDQPIESTIIGVRIPVELRAELERASEDRGGYASVVREALAIHLGRPDLKGARKEAA